MDAASLFASACATYLNEEYEEALKHFTCAVALREDCADYRSSRAAAYLKLGKFAEALEDAQKALEIDASSHMAAHWKGVALFYMGNFAESKAAFEASLRLAPTAAAPRTLWIRKCDSELSGSTLPLGGIVAEASKAVPAASSGAAAGPSPSPPAQAAAPPPAAAAPPDHTTVPSAEGSGAATKKSVRREWYQNSSQVVVTIFAKNVESEQCTVEFKDRALSLSMQLPGSEDQEYALDLELFDEIDSPACKLDVGKMKVELTLAKKNVGVHWRDLEKIEEEPSALDQPAYPTSQKQKKDWNNIDKDCEAELKADGKGDEALNSLFKQIYERADPETRRAMNKSFQTSGGTVLSTNWGEVGKADYEGKDRPTAPEGQEWRDWQEK